MRCILTVLMVVISLATFARPKPKTLHNGWYSYKQLVKRGYTPDTKFKGRKYIKATNNLSLANINLKKN